MNSLNHYAYGSVCEAVYSRVMGLENAAPGWKRARIAPKINGLLKHASIAYDSPSGEWKVQWRIADNGEVTLEIAVPQGASAQVVLPDHPEGHTEEVTGGSYGWSWKPTRDYLHPFSIDSRMMDLLENEEEAAIVREHVPALFYACQGRDNELRVM